MEFGKGFCLLGTLLLLMTLQPSNAAIKTSNGVEDTPCDWPTGQQYWPHPSNCHRYVQCTPYGPQQKRCAPGTAWSQSLLTCDFEANTNCGNQPATSAPEPQSTTTPEPPSTSPPESPTTASTPVCPSPFKLRGTECFFISEDSNDLLNWDESRQRCQSMGGDLAQPQNMVDFVEYIKESYPNSKPTTVWLGATDREVEQDWYWVSGEPVPPAMWEPWPHNQPSGDGDCMEIHYWPRTGFYMNDWHCYKKGYFACEYNNDNEDHDDNDNDLDDVDKSEDTSNEVADSSEENDSSEEDKSSSEEDKSSS